MTLSKKALAQMFGRMGGKARAKKLTAKRRSEIARMGAAVTNAKRTTKN